MMKERKTSSLQFKGMLVILIGLISVTLPLMAQPVDSKETVERIEKDIVIYLRTNDDMEAHSTMQEYRQRVTIVECVDRTVLGYSKAGVYAFSINTSHSKTYLLLKNDQRYEIVDPDDLVTTLQKVAALLGEAKLSNVKAIEYTESVIGIYKMNENRNPARFESKK